MSIVFFFFFKFWQKVIFRLEVEKNDEWKLQIQAIEIIKYDPILIMYSK